MKNERKTIMQAVARAERLEMGKAIKLGLIGEKELKNLTKAYKEYTADPVVKAAAKAKTFARWLGSVALDNGTVPVSYTHLDVYKRQAQTQYQKLKNVYCRAV